MKMNSFKIISLIVLCFFISCKKDQPLPEEFVKLGDGTKMKISSIDTTITGYYHGGEIFDLDLNDDNSPDVRFSSTVWGSPGIGQHPSTYVLCLHNDVKLLGFFKNDTTFIHTASSSYQDNNNILNITITKTFSCDKAAIEDSVKSVRPHEFKLLDKSINEIIYLSNEFKNDTILLNTDTQTYPPDYLPSGPDTIIRVLKIYKSDCYQFPMSTERYIGFKFMENNMYRLGWIKVNLLQANQIKIIESAIQE